MALAKLSNKRATAINRIIEAYNFGVKAKSDTSCHTYFKVLYENLDDAYEDFKTHHNDIIGIVEKDQDFQSQDAVRKDTDSFYFKTKAMFSELFPIDSMPGGAVSLLGQNKSKNKDVDIPPLSVPTFDGNPRKWPTFYDVYRALVHKITRYSDIQKFQYLISFLDKEPSNLLRSLRLIASNYDQAFKTLTGRYQNKRLLATTYSSSLTYLYARRYFNLLRRN